jgi:hypothetical protein
MALEHVWVMWLAWFLYLSQQFVVQHQNPPQIQTSPAFEQPSFASDLVEQVLLSLQVEVLPNLIIHLPLVVCPLTVVPS